MSLTEDQQKELKRLVNIASKLSLAHGELLGARNYLRLATKYSQHPYDLTGIESEIIKLEHEYNNVLKWGEDEIWKDQPDPLYQQLHSTVLRYGYVINQWLDSVKMTEDKQDEATRKHFEEMGIKFDQD